MITVTTPPPLSLNNAYTNGRNGRRVLTKEARRYKRDIEAATLAAWYAAGRPAIDPRGLYAVEIAVYFTDNRRRDLDNQIKLMLDSVCGALGIDDSRVWRICIERRVSYTGESWAELTLRYKE